MRDLEYELHLRQMAGKAIKVAGIAAGFVAMTACSDGKPQKNALETCEGTPTTLREGTNKSDQTGGADPNHPRVYPKNLIPPIILKEDPNAPNRTSNNKARQNSKTKKSASKNPSRGDTAIIQPAIGSDSIESREVYGMAEEMPSFPGGNEALLKYIKANVRYTEEYQEGAATGRVIVGFTVNEDGSLSDIKDISPAIYQAYTGKDNRQVIDNLVWLITHAKHKERIILRLPLIQDFNTIEDRKHSRKELEDIGFEHFDEFEYIVS